MCHTKTHSSLYSGLRLESEIRRHKEIADETQYIPYRVSHIHIDPMQQQPIDSIMNHKSDHTNSPETACLSYYRPFKFQSLNPKL